MQKNEKAEEKAGYEKTEREKKHTEDGTVGSTGAGSGQQKKEENRYEPLSGKNSGGH